MLAVLFVETWGSAQAIIGNAARRLGRIDLVEQPMRNALSAAERSKDSFQRYNCFKGLANFLNKYACKMDEAIEVYETALERFSTREEYECTMRDDLCQLYYHKAKAAESAGTDFDHWLSKLEGSAKIGNILGMRVGTAYASASMVLKLWYRLHGREQEAKLCFLPHILDGIDTLTDDDPENDMFGYMTLAITLLKAGDRRNAGAAFTVIVEPLDRLKDVRQGAQKLSDKNKIIKDKESKVSLHSADAANSTDSLTSAAEKSKTKDQEGNNCVAKNNADQDAIAPDDEKFDMDSAELNAQVKESDGLTTGFPWSCDGRCRRPVEDWEEIHFCEICSNFTCFCDECFKLVKMGTLPFRKCDESHTFYQAYPLSKEMRDIATVRTDGKISPRKEWLEALRREWVA